MVAFVLVLMVVTLSQGTIFVPYSSTNPCETFLTLDLISSDGGSK